MCGVKLHGNKLVKYAYIDESGISVHEPILVVAGVVVDADTQWRRVAEHLDLLIKEFVPEKDRDGFIFHSTKLFHKSSPVPATHSHEALKALLAIPSKFKLSVVFGYIRKLPSQEWPPGTPQREMRERARTQIGLYHSITFSMCALGVERLMREDTHADEIATLVVENNTDTARDVKTAYNAMKGRNLESERERKTFEFLAKKQPELLPIRQIIDVPHMVQKHEASLLQIADACAMVIRHCLEERADAQPFIDVLSVGKPEKIHNDGLFKRNGMPAGYGIITFSTP
jgi:hypothetical protein